MGASTLNHEIFNHTVKVQSVVVSHGYEFDEIGHRIGGTTVKEVDGDVACACFHKDLHGGTTERHFKRICFGWHHAHLDNEGPLQQFMTDILDVEFLTMDGETTTLRQLGGSRWLVVNVASVCGATPQYGPLQALHEAHDDLTVVGFPCNQFGAQEPGTHDEICDFTSSKYNVTFPLMAKVDVNGEGQTPLFAALNQSETESGRSGDIRWNFEKFLIDAEGEVQRFGTRTQPDTIPL